MQVNDRLPSEAELSRRFGVSRPIVCEALGRLQALGLTEARAGRGTFVASSVTKLTITFGQYSASDLNEVRRCVEVPAARLAALRRTSEDIQLLASILGAHEQASGAEEAVATDAGFIARSLRRRATSSSCGWWRICARSSRSSRWRCRRCVIGARRSRGSTAGDGEAVPSAMSDHLDAVERAILSGPARAAEQGRA